MSLRLGKLMVALGILAALLATALAPKAPANEAAAKASRGVIVKFIEGSDVRLRGGLLISESGQPMTGVANALARRAGARAARLFSRPEETLASEKARGQARSNRPLPDLNLFYRIQLPPGADPEELVTELKTLPIVENAYLEPLPAPPPVTPDLESGQGYLDAAPDGIGARIAWQIPGGRGAGVTIGDVEYSWNTNHEDLPTATASKILLNSGETATDPFSNNDHGTAVLGEIIAANNGFGVTGIVADADIRMAPADIDGSYNVAEGINRAAGALGAGDVILIEQQTEGANGGCGMSQVGCVAVEFHDAEFAAIQAAVALGIVVVEAAGNGSEDLDSAAYDGSNFRDDSGAIIVGAGAAPGSSDPARSKLGFSTFGSRVDVQGWGNAIVSTGYGDHPLSPGSSQQNDAYTNSFGGTSGASPIVTGAAAVIQGTRLARGAAPLSPAEMRTLLKTTGTPQQDDSCTVAECPIGPLPNLAEALTADVSLTKSDSPDPVVAGQFLYYTVTAHNAGPNLAPDVVVVDTLPAGVTYVVDTDACVQAPAGTLTCNLGDIPAGESRTFTIQVSVSPGAAPGVLTNNATVSSALADPNSSDNTASAVTIVNEQADLRVLKECKPDQPNKQPAGTPTFCDIYVDNLGPSDARNVVIKDTIISSTPVSISSVVSTSTVNPAAVCAPLSSGPVTSITITCADSVLPAGARDTIRVTFVAANAGDVDDTACVSSDTPDPNISNNCAVGRVSFAAASDLALLKDATPNPVTAGQNLTYQLHITNLGPSAAPNVVVRDSLPAQVSFVSSAPSQGSCQAGVVPGDPAKPLTCNLGALASGAGATITVIVKVNSDVPAGTILVNNADVSSDNADPNNGNNLATAATTVQTSADLAIAKTSDSDTYKPSTEVKYQITVSNNGPSKALSAVVTDDLPEIKQALYQSDTGGCVKSTPTTLVCAIGDLAVGQTRTFFIYVVIKGSQGNVTNTASVASPTPDPALANNSSTRVVLVGKK